MKKVFYFSICFVFAFCLCILRASAVEKVDASLKIYDYGDFLTEEQEIELADLISDYTYKYDLDMVIVTKKDYPYEDMEEYAQDFYDYNDFGVGKTHDGIILFFNVDSEGPAAWITTTGNAILMYDDDRIDGLLAFMKSEKVNGYYSMIKSFVNHADTYASRGIPESNKDMYIDEDGEYREKRVYPAAQIFIGALAITLITTIILALKNKTVNKAIDANKYLVNRSLKITKKYDKLIFTNTSLYRIDTSSGSSGGGSHHSGGSSVHHGSSGISHGGGGGRL